MEIKNLDKNKVFQYFEEISQIPRGSKNEKQISDFLVNFAKERNLNVVQDKAYNVIIKKPGTSGLENAPGVILQGHMDMVNEKNDDHTHDFLKDPLDLYIDGDFLKARGTTLGADNGVAVAMCMAILDGNYTHPPLAMLITTDEEAGMSGAKAVDPSLFQGYTSLINLDSGEEGEFTVSCAGGLRHSIEYNFKYTKVPAGYKGYALKVKGLQGGHSGGDIHLGLANSNRLMGRLLYAVLKQGSSVLCDISGGLKVNAIPREAQALIAIDPGFKDTFLKTVNDMETSFKGEYRETEPDLTIEINEVEAPAQAISGHKAWGIISVLTLAPLGVSMANKKGETLVSNSIGVVTSAPEKVTIEFLSRSAIYSQLKFMEEQISNLANIANAQYIYNSGHAGWEYRENSPIRDKCVAVYKEMYGKAPEITSTHGGLECGILSDIMPNMDMISMGPNNYHLHTPKEQLSISSTIRVYEYLTTLLSKLG